MKTRILFSIAFMALTTLSFAQKKEVKEIEKAVKNGEYGTARTAVAAAEALLGQMDDKYKERFYLAKAQAFLGVDNTNMEELLEAGKAFNELKDGKFKAEAAAGIRNVIAGLVNGAVANQNKQEYTTSAEQLNAAYQLSKTDTIYLYYAANNYVNAKAYDKALGYYEQLRDLNFSGIETQYVATAVDSGKEETFPSKQERDFSVLAKTHINPTEKKTDSKVGEIAKQIALIHLTLGDTDKALQAMKDARAKNPDDVYLIRSEADVYLKMGDMARYQATIEQVLEKEPDNAELYYNLGVSAASQGNTEDAVKFYTKATEIDPNYASAFNNLAVIKLGAEKVIVEEMNNLGTSRADYARYDELKAKRQDVYRDAAPFLEKALSIKENDPKADVADKLSIAKTLFGIYQYLGEDAMSDAIKSKIDALEGN